MLRPTYFAKIGLSRLNAISTTIIRVEPPQPFFLGVQNGVKPAQPDFFECVKIAPKCSTQTNLKKIFSSTVRIASADCECRAAAPGLLPLRREQAILPCAPSCGLARIPGFTQTLYRGILSHRIVSQDPPRLIHLNTKGRVYPSIDLFWCGNI